MRTSSSLKEWEAHQRVDVDEADHRDILVPSRCTTAGAHRGADARGRMLILRAERRVVHDVE
jgi:hypothetical protein